MICKQYGFFYNNETEVIVMNENWIRNGKFLLIGIIKASKVLFFTEMYLVSTYSSFCS